MAGSNSLLLTFFLKKYHRQTYKSIMVNVKSKGRGFPHKRGHQYNVRFSGDRCSNVAAEEVLAALRAGCRIPVVRMTQQIPSVNLQEATGSIDDITDRTTRAPITNAPFPNEFQEVSSPNVMKDPYKLALYDTGLIDPDIIVAQCQCYGDVKHCRRFKDYLFILFNRRE